MKNIFRIMLIALLTFSLASSIALAAKPIINADAQYLDPSTGLYVLKGNVYIETGNRIITAGQARVDLASLEVWGSGGINLKQDNINFTGDSVYVYGTQHRAVIEGGVCLLRPDLKIVADRTEFNWRSKIANFTGNVEVTQNSSTWTADSVSYNVETNTIL